jgi:hypothetical protein
MEMQHCYFSANDGGISGTQANVCVDGPLIHFPTQGIKILGPCQNLIPRCSTP